MKHVVQNDITLKLKWRNWERENEKESEKKELNVIWKFVEHVLYLSFASVRHTQMELTGEDAKNGTHETHHSHQFQLNFTLSIILNVVTAHSALRSR